MYNKIYINLDNIGDEIKTEIEEYSFLLKEKNINNIWNHFRIKKKIEDREKFMISVFSLELYLFINYLNNLGYDLSKIEILKDRPMFIYNDDLYKIEDFVIEKMDTDNVGFFSVRGTNWNYPFFYILNKLIRAKGGVMTKSNDINRNLIWKGKFYALNSIYTERKKLIGDIVIPYKISENLYNIFSDFLKKKIGGKIVLKKDSTQLGQGVYVVDLDNYDLSQQNKFKKVMLGHKEFGKEVYITPFKQFKEEYRIYFTKFKGDIKIFSVKKKIVTTPLNEIVKADNFEYYTNVMLEWSYIENKNWDKKLIKVSKHYIDKLEYTTGALEFGKTLEGKLVFFEVNSMADPICYEGEDMKNMTKYYKSIFKSFL